MLGFFVKYYELAIRISEYILLQIQMYFFNESTVDSLRKLFNNNLRLLMVSTVMTDSKGKKEKNTAWKILSPFKYMADCKI